MGKPLWTFDGYITESGNRVVQDWYWKDLSVDDRDYIRDRISRLENVERTSWGRPGFAKLADDLCEIKKNTPAGAIRIYGHFPQERYHFTLLYGHYKKVDNDKRGKRAALDRLKLLKRGIGGVHEFEFEEESD